MKFGDLSMHVDLLISPIYGNNKIYLFVLIINYLLIIIWNWLFM